MSAAAGPGAFAALRALHGAELANVDTRIAPGDTMFAGSSEHYARVGRSAWAAIAPILLQAGVEVPRRVLDLPCGHGRVLRVLQRALPDAAFTACDLDADGVAWCAAELGATPVVSDVDLDRVIFEAPFDLIWCGSLLTHLDQPGWAATMRLFERSLAPRGVAVFTTHGRWVAHRIDATGERYGLTEAAAAALVVDARRTGFAYADYPASPGYGVSLNTLGWLAGELAGRQGLRLVAMAERAWDEHQDVIAVQRVW